MMLLDNKSPTFDGLPINAQMLTNLVDILVNRAINSPEQNAYTFLLDGEVEQISLTYQELDKKVRNLASQLQSLDSQGERALLLYPPGIEFIIAFLGCLYAGIIAVPLYPPRRNQKLSRLQSIVTDSQAKFALTTQEIFQKIDNQLEDDLRSLQWIKTDQNNNFSANSWAYQPIDPNNIAFLQYTSGSTGTPKGVMVSHENLIHNLEYIKQAFELTSSSVSVTWLPSFHDMGLIDGLLEPLYTGYWGILMSPVAFVQKPIRWLQAISDYQATHCGGPNFAYELCLDKISPEQLENLNLKSWSSAYTGAQPVRQETLERFATKFKKCGFQSRFFYPCYGLAESTLMVSGVNVKDEPTHYTVQADALEKNQIIKIEDNDSTSPRKLVSCGHTWLDTKVCIVEPHTLTLCSDDTVGEIWVSGKSVAQGYWNRPEQTKATFKAQLASPKYQSDTFLRTGDLGFLSNGELFITGRLKDLIIIQGRNLYPQDIEFTAENCHPALRKDAGAAFSIDIEGSEQLMLVQEVERSHIRHLKTDEVIEAIRKAILAEYEVNIYGVTLLKTGSIPKTSSGKIQRQGCKVGFLDNSLNVVGSSLLETVETEMALDEEILTSVHLSNLSPEEQKTCLKSYLPQWIAKILKISTSELTWQKSLQTIGIDSLKAIELQHQLETELNVHFPMYQFLEDITLEQISDKILEQIKKKPEKLKITPVSITQGAEFQLSHNQSSMWFVQELLPTSAAYNVSFAIRINGELKIPALEEAMKTLIMRHYSLRASISLSQDTGKPFQKVIDANGNCLTYVQANHLSEEELQEHLDISIHRPFNLEKDLLLRGVLYQVSSKNLILLLTAHHIACDLWSLLQLFKELGGLYQEKLTNHCSTLSPLTWSYFDYVNWQKSYLASKEGEQLQQYWQTQLADCSPVLNLPTDFPRPPLQSYQGAYHRFELSNDLAVKSKIFAKEQGVTLYVLLLATFQLLLHRYTNQKDLLVGSPITGRSRSEFKDIVGYFVNPVVLRAKFSDGLLFTDFLNQVRQTVLEALEHQDYPFECLVECLQPQRETSHSPLFQVMFVLQNTGDLEGSEGLILKQECKMLNWGDMTVESVAIEQKTAQFDLTLMVVETPSGLSASFEYNTDLFSSSTMARIAGHFQTLLEGVVNNPQQPIVQVPLLTYKEEKQLLIEWNQTEVTYPNVQALHHLIEAQVEQTPDNIAVIFEDVQLTYEQLNNKANQLAHTLQKRGINSEKLVGICLDRSLEMMIGLLGVLKAGGAYVPIDPNYPQDRVQFMLEDSQISILLTSAEKVKQLPEYSASVICLDRDWEEQIAIESETNPQTEIAPNNLAYVIYTSGSTGKPKGAMNTHQGIINRLLWMQDAYQLTEKDRILQKTPFSFDVSVWEFFWPLLTGSCLVFAKPNGHQDSRYLVQLIIKEQITTIHFVPSMLRIFLEETQVSQCDSLKRVICSGEALPFELQQRFFEHLSAELHNLYGPTEAAIDVTYWQCQPQSVLNKVPIGRPIANIQLYILDAQLQPVPIGVPGELHIGGIGLARGYLNRPELTSEKFIGNPFGEKESYLYKTGDLARYLPDGNIEYLGRLDHQVKLRGLRIELGEIEAMLAQHHNVQDVVVIVREDDPGDQRLVAYLVVKEESSTQASQLNKFLAKLLPKYMIPATYVVLDALPLSPNGKVDRRALPAPLNLRPQLASDYVVPQNHAEHLISDIWQEALNLERVGIDDNFFDLGGNSLLMTQIHRQLQDMFPHQLSLIEMFKYPTVRSLAQVLTQSSNSVNSVNLLPSDVSENQCQERKERKTLMRQKRQRRTSHRSNHLIDQ